MDETATGSVNLFGRPASRALFSREEPLDAVLEFATLRGLALARRDWDTVAAVTANGQRLDRDRYLTLLANGPVRWNAQTLEDVQIVDSGPVKVLVARVVDDVVHDGAPARWEFATTQTYVRENGSWLYLAGHTALPVS